MIINGNFYLKKIYVKKYFKIKIKFKYIRWNKVIKNLHFNIE